MCLFTCLLFDLGQDLLVRVQQVLLVTNLDRVAAKGGQEHAVARLDRGRDDLAGGGVGDARARRNNGGLVQLLLVLLGDVYAGRGLGSRLDSLHQDTVEQGLQRLCGLQER